MIKKTSFFLFICVCSLGWFVWNGVWYEKSQLVIQGYVPDIQTSLTMNWDSGHGYNDYEREYFSLDTVLPAGKKFHEISIRNTGTKNSASLRNDIVCSAILIDGRKQDLHEFIPEGGKLTDKGILLNKKGAELRIKTGAKKNIHIELLTNNYSGIAEISVNDKNSTHDLYIANIEAKNLSVDYWIVGENGGFTVWMDLPRYRVNELAVRTLDGENIRFTSAKIRTADNTHQLLSRTMTVDSLLLMDITRFARKHFHPVQFIFQIFFAVLTTWIVYALITLRRKYKGLADIFIAEDRSIFWGLLLFSISIYSVWLISFWPGVMSVDSLKVWRAASLPEVFLNDHPLLNVIFYMYLKQIWNNVAVVPVAHILLMSLLNASIFFWLYKRGIPFFLLLPFYILLVLSIPVGLYNLMLWKDIPFAILIVFWGFTMVRLYEMKKEGKQLSLHRGLVLLLLLLALVLTRHNGIIYLAYIPFLALLIGLLPVQRIIVGAGGIIVVVAVIFFLARSGGHLRDATYLVDQGQKYVQQVIKNGVAHRIVKASGDYWGILNINQTASKWDLFHYYLHDRYAYRFLSRAGWNDVYPYLPGRPDATGSMRETAMDIYWASYKQPWIYFTWNPVYMLALFLFPIIFFFRLPRSAIYSSIFLVQVASLLIIVQVLNWRYYYFVLLGSYFLVPVIMLDLLVLIKQSQNKSPI